MMNRIFYFLIFLVSFLSCQNASPTAGQEGTKMPDRLDAVSTAKYSPIKCLKKASLDLVSNPVSDAKIADLESGTISLNDAVNELLEDKAFETTVSNWFKGFFPRSKNTKADTDSFEPVRIATYVTLNADFREIITGKYTIDPNGLRVPITDRPAAGILSTRHYMESEQGGYRRNWAGRFVKTLGGVTLTPAVVPPGTPTDPTSIKSNPSCKGCHTNPFYGIDHVAAFSLCYNESGQYINGCQETEGSFLGKTDKGLEALARITAPSNEFIYFAVRFFFTQLFDRDMSKKEIPLYDRIAAKFVISGYQAKILIRELVTSPEYCSE